MGAIIPPTNKIEQIQGLQGAINATQFNNRGQACCLVPNGYDPFGVDTIHYQTYARQSLWACDDITGLKATFFNGYYDTSTVDHSYQGTGGAAILPAFISHSFRYPQNLVTSYSPYQSTMLSSHWFHLLVGGDITTDANSSFTVPGPIFGAVNDPSATANLFVTNIPYANPRLSTASPFNILLWTSGANVGFTEVLTAVNNSSGFAQIATNNAFEINGAPSTGDTFILYTIFMSETNWNVLFPPQNISISAISGGSLTSGIPYYYFLSVLSPAGESAPSTSVTVTPSGSNLSASLSWIQTPNTNPPPNNTTFTGYPIAQDFQTKIYRSLTNFATTASLLTTLAAGITSFVDTGVIAPASSTITVTIATPGVITWTAHGLAAYSPVYFTTTGALPTGLAINTTYYVVAGASLTTNTFELATSVSNAVANTPINTTGTQSGTHTAYATAFLTPIATGSGNGMPQSFPVNTNSSECSIINPQADLTLRGIATTLNVNQGIGVGARMVTGIMQNLRPPSFLGIGDSIMQATGDGAVANYTGPKGYPARAMALLGYPFTNSAQGSNTIAAYNTAGNITFRQTQYANHKYTFLELNRNDLLSFGATAQTVANNIISRAKIISGVGSRVIVTTCMMSTTSTDNWLSFTGQTVLNTTNETQRIAFNTWVRAGCPVDPVNFLYVTPGTAGAILCPYIFTTIDVVAPVEYGLISAGVYGLKQNGGLWGAQVTPTIASIAPSASSSGSTVTFTGTPFTNGTLYGQSGLVLSGTGSATLAQINNNTANTITFNGSLTVDTSSRLQIYELYTNNDGVHPSAFYGHMPISQYIVPLIKQQCPVY